MPNHITNILQFSGTPKGIHQMLEAIKSEKHGIETVDFNKIIPMPKSLNTETGSSTDNGLRAYKAFIKVYTLGGTMNNLSVFRSAHSRNCSLE